MLTVCQQVKTMEQECFQGCKNHYKDDYSMSVHLVSTASLRGQENSSNLGVNKVVRKSNTMKKGPIFFSRSYQVRRCMAIDFQ